jgi:hypothetical protein
LCTSLSLDVPVEIPSRTGYQYDPYWGEAEQPDEQGRSNGNPQIITGYTGRLAQFEYRSSDESDYGRTYAFENTLYYLIVLKLLEKHGNEQYDNKRG